jgi:hypothetical protein
MKSERQADLMADCWAAVTCGAAGAAAAVATGFGAGLAGFGTAMLAAGGLAVAIAGAGAAGATGGGATEVAVGAGGGGTGVGAGAGAGGATTAAGFGKVARTALWQLGDSFDTFFCRHCSASAPPGRTPEQFDMKSERQDDFSAACCSAVTWAKALCANARPIAPAIAAVQMRCVCAMSFPLSEAAKIPRRRCVLKPFIPRAGPTRD